MGNVQQHLALIGAAAADLFLQWRKDAMHLHAQRPRLGLALTLSGRVFTQAREVLLADRVIGNRLLLPWAAVINDYLQMHFCLATQALNVREKLTLIRPD